MRMETIVKILIAISERRLSFLTRKQAQEKVKDTSKIVERRKSYSDGQVLEMYEGEIDI